MPVTPPITEPSQIFSALDVITDALIEVNIGTPGEPADSDTAAWAFRKLNYLTDKWAAMRSFVYAFTFNVYTLVPNLSPHLIGPAPGYTFFAVQRPTKIIRATIILNNTAQPYTSVPLNIRDDQWWLDNTIQALTSQQPTDLYYDPTFPNGSIYYWPVPTTAYQTQLECWAQISQYSSIDDPLGGPAGPGTLPPGYRNALMLSLAETLGGMPPDSLRADAAAARAAVFNLNSQVPRMMTRDSGIPGADEDYRSTTFNYLNRSGA